MMVYSTAARLFITNSETGAVTDIPVHGPFSFEQQDEVLINTPALVFARLKFKVHCHFHQTRRQRQVFNRAFGLRSGRRAQRRAHRKRMKRR